MSPLAARLARTVREAGLFGPGDRVVAAVSGGGDSVALLYLLAEVAPSLGCAMAGVVHVHHGLRGASADADERCAAGHAAALGLPVVVERADVRALARARRCSVEAAGRAVREEAFERAAGALAATHVATGHTLDDQAETVLLRLARGTGLTGLCGIRRVRGAVVRPLLDCRRLDLRAYLEARGLSWREDETNDDCGVRRNRVRHRVLPLLSAELSPRIVEALARVADLAAADDAVLGAVTAQATPAILGPDGLHRARLLAAPLAIQRRVVKQWLEATVPGPATGLAHVEAVLALARGGGDSGGRALPGRTVAVAEGRLTVQPAAGRRRSSGASRNCAAAPCRFRVPGVLSLAGPGLQVSATVVPATGEAARRLVAERAGADTAVLDAAVAGDLLAVRFWRPGDRMQPLGMSGHRKLQDLFVDRKVPAGSRPLVPLVVDADDRILWAAGLVVSAAARVTPATTRVLLLQLQRSGGVV